MTAAEVKELVELVGSTTLLWSFLLVVAVFGFAPVLIVRLFVLLYPSGHLRRAELVAEMRSLTYVPRVFFAAEVVATALVEGIGERIKARRLLPAQLRVLRGRVWGTAFGLVKGVVACVFGSGLLITRWADLPAEVAPVAGWAWTAVVALLLFVLLRRLVRGLTDLAVYRRAGDNGNGDRRW